MKECMIETHNATEFKSHCLSIMKDVHDKHIECLVTKHGKPFVKVIPFKTEDEKIFGCMKGTGKDVGDIFSTGEKWDADK